MISSEATSSNPGEIELAPEQAKEGLGLGGLLLHLLLAHVDPVLELLGHDHIEHHDRARGALDAARGIVERAFDLLALVDDEQELAEVARFERAALLFDVHARMLPRGGDAHNNASMPWRVPRLCMTVTTARSRRCP